MPNLDLKTYTPDNITIGVLGSHSALEICTGAQQAGLPNLVIAQKGREHTYSKHLKTTTSGTNETFGCVDDTLPLDTFTDILKPDVQQQLLNRKVIFIPHRSFEVYVCQDNYDVLANQFPTPIFGNRHLLKAEERTEGKNQYYLLERAGIAYPQQFLNHDDIDRLVIVKVPAPDRKFERGFFFAHSPIDFKRKVELLLDDGKLTENELENAVIEEFIVGPTINLNFFYSPLYNRLELLGTDTRRQTNLDGLLRLPASQQLELSRNGIKPTFEEAGHIATTILESMLEEAYTLGERFVQTVADEFPPAMIGPFALQCAIAPGPPKKSFVVYDVSLRMPGAPGITATPYSQYLWKEPVSMGYRVALEIKKAATEGNLHQIVT